MPHDHFMTYLCIGGPLNGKRRLPPDNPNANSFPAFVDGPKTLTADADYQKREQKPVPSNQIVEYRKQSFHTERETISCWAPSDQTPGETLIKLMEIYRLYYEQLEAKVPNK